MSVGRSQPNTIRLTGRHYVLVNYATSLTSLDLSVLSLDARLVSVSDAFQEYRFNKVTVTATPAAQGPFIGLSYQPGLLSTAPASLGDLQNLENTAYGNGLFGSPVPRLRLAQRQLLGAAPVKWFRRGTAYDDTVELQGRLFLASSVGFNTTAAYLHVDYEVELRASADTAETSRSELKTAWEDLDPVTVQLHELQRVLGVAARVPNPLREAGSAVRPSSPALTESATRASSVPARPRGR